MFTSLLHCILLLVAIKQWKNKSTWFNLVPLSLANCEIGSHCNISNYSYKQTEWLATAPNNRNPPSTKSLYWKGIFNSIGTFYCSASPDKKSVVFRIHRPFWINSRCKVRLLRIYSPSWSIYFPSFTLFSLKSLHVPAARPHSESGYTTLAH